MPRSLPNCPARPENLRPWDGFEKRSYSIKVVTPMFGGGVEPGESDPVTLIRPSSIRGHLRFWWRATRGAKCADTKELKQREVEIFGDTKNPSHLDIVIQDVTAPTSSVCAEYGARHDGKLQLRWREPFDGHENSIPYALFPFQGRLNQERTVIEKSPSRFIHGVSFTLAVRFPNSLRIDVESALSGWLNFGGLGARTRRGCGSLFCKDIAPPKVGELAELSQIGAEVCEWPTLPVLQDILFKPSPKNPLEAWKDAVAQMRDFRQGVGWGRNPGKQSNRPGRSRWSEPESIREQPNSGANRQTSGHQRLEAVPVDAFPRAALGLPIVFHFQGRGEPPGPAVADWTLYPQNDTDDKPRDRMASPVITKPLVLKDGSAVPLVMVLRTAPLTGVELRSRNQKTGENLSLGTWGEKALHGGRLSNYANSPLRLAQSGSAIDALVAFAKQPNRGFKGVTS